MYIMRLIKLLILIVQDIRSHNHIHFRVLENIPNIVSLKILY